jgi:APA family basic amino acid/polyamine antiporter
MALMPPVRATRNSGVSAPAARAPKSASAAAIAAQAVWSGLLVLSGTFEQLLIYTGFAVVLFAGLAVMGLLVLRRRHAGQVLPYRGWGSAWAPAVFVLASLAMVVNAVRERPLPSAAGLMVIGAGVPVYWWFKRGKA